MKNIKKYSISFVTFLIIISLLLSFSSIAAFANESGEETQLQPIKDEQQSITVEEEIASDVIESEELVQLEKRTLSAVFDRRKHAKEEIKISFDKTDVKNYYYEFEGIEVVEIPGAKMSFEILSTEDELGKIDVYADYGEGELIKSSIYTYSAGDFVYLSDISQDQAWYDCMYERYSQGLLSLDALQDEYDNFTRQYCIEEDVSCAFFESDQLIMNDQNSLSAVSETPEKITVQGKISWETSGAGTYLPLRQTKIELRDDQLVGSRLIATTYTDVNGDYSFEIDSTSAWYNLEIGGLDLFVRWYTESDTFEVGADWAITNYSFVSRIDEDVAAGANIDFSYITVYDESMSGNKATYIQQGMVLAQRFAELMGMETQNFIHVAYPGSLLTVDWNGDGVVDNDTFENIGIDQGAAFCWGNVANNCFSAIGLNAWNNIDTIIHEYGHFVQNSIGTYGSSLIDIIIYNPNYDIFDDMFTAKDDKAFAMDLVWSESWATVFSQIAQETFALEYSGITNLADQKDSDLDVENYLLGIGDIEEFNRINNNRGEFQIYAVTALLYDLYDSGTNELVFDDFELSAQNWWNCTTRSGTHNLTDFANVMHTYYVSQIDDMGILLSHYKISVDSMRIDNDSSVFEKQAPVVSWIVGGSKDHKNNMFEVVVFGSDGNYLTQTPAISIGENVSHTYRVSYTIPDNVWQYILMNTKDIDGKTEIVFYVKAYRVDDITSGPYYSSHQMLSFPRNATMNLSARNRYAERVVDIPQGEYRDIYLSFEVGGINVVQTFGTNFPFIYLYNMQGVLLKTNMDSGYETNALFSYDFAADTIYILRVEYFKTAHFGDVRVAITPSADRFNTYDAFYTVTGAATSYSGSVTYCDSLMFTYMLQEDKVVTFTTSAEFDAYMYIIDPRSVELVSSSSNSPSTEDDDSAGRYDAMIEKTISANVEYLIIITPYNPYAENGSVTIYFT